MRGDISRGLIEDCNELSEEECIQKYKSVLRKKCSPREIKTIAINCEGLADGGIEKVIANLSRIFCEMGVRVVLYTRKPPSENDYDYPQEIKRITVPGDENLPEKLYFYEESFCEEKIDVYIFNNWNSESLVWELCLMKTMDIPLVVYVHGHFTYPYSIMNRYGDVIHKVYRLCDEIVCLDESSHRFYEKMGCNSTLIHNPVPYELYNVEPTPAFNKKVLWIGRIVKGKRFEDAISIIKKVKEKIPDVTLEVVGTGAEFKRMKKRVAKEKLKDTILFHGFHKDTSGYFKQCSCMLLTTEKEGFCFTLLESKAYGLPVVMYKLPYLMLVKDQKGLKESSIGNIDEMADNLIQLLNDKEMMKKLSLEARESFLTYKQNDIVEDWKEVFYKLNKENSIYTFEENEMEYLIEEERSSFRRYYNGSLERKIGCVILAFPRYIKRVLKRK